MMIDELFKEDKHMSIQIECQPRSKSLDKKTDIYYEAITVIYVYI